MNSVHVKVEDSSDVLAGSARGQNVQFYGPPQPGYGVLRHPTSVSREQSGNANMRPFPAHQQSLPAGGPNGHASGPDSVPLLPPHPANYQMNNGMSDPSLQEYLSPFFQPYGVDVSHFPLTNPPIFQSSLTNFSDHPRRRRISISNGQISQLGDATHSFDDLYYSQPPPMPIRHEHKNSATENKSGSYPQQHSQPPQPPQPAQPVQMAHQHLQTPAVSATQHHSQPQQSYQTSQGPGSKDYNIHALTPKLDDEVDPTDPIIHEGYNGKDVTEYKNPVQANAMIPQSLDNVYPTMRHGVLPGTPAWKRARLLERNRIAASKCRQRKKFAHQQLQEDAELLSRENMEMRKRLQYFERLVLKFKRFTEMHMASCGGSEQLSMFEELLKIDHNMTDSGPPTGSDTNDMSDS
ncbi:LAFA_0A05930g1_1 [Lachancea sp. 'fantastica']|nr:LAFA_0A05930g1_1 [Lachancea sp. 'fantastica']